MMGEGWGMSWGMGGYGGIGGLLAVLVVIGMLSSCSGAEAYDPQAHDQRPTHSGCMSFSNPQS